ncbi:MAG: CRTAC1 family protein [Gammaproteobacteria bacterium]
MNRNPFTRTAFIVACALATSCSEPVTDTPNNAPLFEELAGPSGLVFEHVTGATGEYYLNEMIGAGAALFDADNDGDLDVYLVQSGSQKPDNKHSDRFFRNQLIPTGELKFIDVTAEAGIESHGYSMGVAVADFDNDGDSDLYITQYGKNRLLRNDSGIFTDVTERSGTGDSGWGTSASFLDYDNDGLLDLFVANYVNFSVERNKKCFAAHGARDYCAPGVYISSPDSLYRNLGNGTFSDVSVSSGIRAAFGPGLGVIGADFNQDGYTDIYVANDQMANQLWLNAGDGTFKDSAMMSGSALNVDGQPEASMGVTAGDFDSDGDEDLFMTHLNGQSNTLYRNDGKGNFIDSTARFGLASLSLPYTGFGSAWFDLENDGRLDLYIANGAIDSESGTGVEHPYAQRNQLFVQKPDGKFTEIVDDPSLQLMGVSRGAAFGDIDNDGDTDILVTNNDGPAHLLINKAATTNNWISVRLRGKTANRDGLGALVVVRRDGAPDLWRRAHTDGSYLNANDPRVHFGLATSSRINTITVYWPGGDTEQWSNVETNQFITLVQGSGQASRSK